MNNVNSFAALLTEDEWTDVLGQIAVGRSEVEIYNDYEGCSTHGQVDWSTIDNRGRGLHRFGVENMSHKMPWGQSTSQSPQQRTKLLTE